MENSEIGLRNSTRNARELRQARNRAVIAECIDTAKQNIRESPVSGKNFETSMTRRGLFTVTRERGLMYDPLAMNLLGINPEDLTALQEAVEGKKILAIGGGESLDDMTSMRSFSPTTFLNVDPYLKKESLRRKLAPYYQSLPFDPTKKDFVHDLQTSGYGTFDEIWATYSLPQYCEDPEEVTQFFENMYEALAPDGTLRIFPLVFYAQRSRSSPLLIAGLSAALNKLAKESDVELSVRRDTEDPGAVTLEIHRLKS